MANTKKAQRALPLPKQIRNEVRSILRNAKQKNGVLEAAILFVDSRGRLRAIGTGSDLFHVAMSNAMNGINLVQETANAAYVAGLNTQKTA